AFSVMDARTGSIEKSAAFDASTYESRAFRAAATHSSVSNGDDETESPTIVGITHGSREWLGLGAAAGCGVHATTPARTTIPSDTSATRRIIRVPRHYQPRKPAGIRR